MSSSTSSEPTATASSAKDQARASQSGDSLIRKEKLPSGLYVVATPIGNLRDVTLRALDTLSSVDLVYAEDTRQTRRLFDAYGIKTSLRTYHDHNGAIKRPEILEEIRDGKSIALVSDAGTPLISDPGFKLVRDLREAEEPVIPIPGPSALTAALSAAGLPTDCFLFAGFLPVKSHARQNRLSDFKTLQTTLAIYESGNRLADTLADIIAVYGDIDVVMARELTKLFETFRMSKASDLIAFIKESGPPKGEIVLLASLTGVPGGEPEPEDIEAFLLERLDALGAKGAANEAAKHFNRPKREVYAMAVTLKQSKDGKG